MCLGAMAAVRIVLRCSRRHRLRLSRCEVHAPGCLIWHSRREIASRQLARGHRTQCGQSRSSSPMRSPRQQPLPDCRRRESGAAASGLLLLRRRRGRSRASQRAAVCERSKRSLRRASTAVPRTAISVGSGAVSHRRQGDGQLRLFLLLQDALVLEVRLVGDRGCDLCRDPAPPCVPSCGCLSQPRWMLQLTISRVVQALSYRPEL